MASLRPGQQHLAGVKQGTNPFVDADVGRKINLQRNLLQSQFPLDLGRSLPNPLRRIETVIAAELVWACKRRGHALCHECLAERDALLERSRTVVQPG